MSLSIAAITFDCADATKLGDFWSAVMNRPLDPEPSRFFASIGRASDADAGNAGPTMMFIQVDEPKSAKNRVHLDLQADDRADEVERLTALGATVIHDKDEWGTRWTTLADPEGNEFCVATH